MARRINQPQEPTLRDMLHPSRDLYLDPPPAKTNQLMVTTPEPTLRDMLHPSEEFKRNLQLNDFREQHQALRPPALRGLGESKPQPLTAPLGVTQTPTIRQSEVTVPLQQAPVRPPAGPQGTPPYIDPYGDPLLQGEQIQPKLSDIPRALVTGWAAVNKPFEDWAQKRQEQRAVPEVSRSEIEHPSLSGTGLTAELVTDSMGRARIEFKGNPDRRHIAMIPGNWDPKKEAWVSHPINDDGRNITDVNQGQIDNLLNIFGQRTQKFDNMNPLHQALAYGASRFQEQGAQAITFTPEQSKYASAPAETFGEKAVDTISTIAGRGTVPLPGMQGTMYGELGKAVGILPGMKGAEIGAKIAAKIPGQTTAAAGIAHGTSLGDAAARIVTGMTASAFSGAATVGAGSVLQHVWNAPTQNVEEIEAYFGQAGQRVLKDALWGGLFSAVLTGGMQAYGEVKFARELGKWRDVSEILAPGQKTGKGTSKETSLVRVGDPGDTGGRPSLPKSGVSVRIKNGRVEVQAATPDGDMAAARVLTYGLLRHVEHQEILQSAQSIAKARGQDYSNLPYPQQEQILNEAMNTRWLKWQGSAEWFKRVAIDPWLTQEPVAQTGLPGQTKPGASTSGSAPASVSGTHPQQTTPGPVAPQVAPAQPAPLTPGPGQAPIVPPPTPGTTAPPITIAGNSVQVGQQVTIKGREGTFTVTDTSDKGFIRVQTPDGGIMPVGRKNIESIVTVEPDTSPSTKIQPETTVPVPDQGTPVPEGNGTPQTSPPLAGDSGAAGTPSVRYVTGGDAVGKEYHGYIQAVDESTGELMGYIDYASDGKAVYIKMIEVDPGFRRQGIATGLVNQVREQAGVEIDILGNVVTKEGQALLRSTGILPANEPRAAKPAPAKAEPLPEPTSIAPPILKGKEATVKTERGTEAPISYALVEADDLVASHDTTLRPDQRYPAEMQPRDRGRAASEMQVNSILGNLEPAFLGESPKASEGRMLVDERLNVISGNGRVIALKRGYEQNHENMGKYRQWLLDNAEKFGIDPEAIQAAQKPVLVGQLQGEGLSLVQFAKEANESSVASMSATEQAKADAPKLSGGIMELFHPGENGEIITASNRDFVRAFMGEVVGPTEQGRYMMGDGSISQEGIARIRNAVFARAYEDVAVIERLSESPDNNIRNITNAMLKAAPRFAAIKDGIEKGERFDLDLAPEIAEVAKQLSALRDSGMKVEDFLKQPVVFEEAQMSPLARDLLEVFHKYARSAKKLAEILDLYAEGVEVAGDPRQETFFGQNTPTKAEVLEAAIRRFERGGYETTIFENQAESSAGAGEAPGEKTKTKTEREPFVVKDAATAEQIIKAGDSTYSVTLAPSAQIPLELAIDLRDLVEGWKITRHEDGSVTFSRPNLLLEDNSGYTLDKPTANALRNTYAKFQVREGDDPEIVKDLAGKAMSGLHQVPEPQSMSGILEQGGIRTVALGIRRTLIKDGRISLEGQVVKSAKDLAVIAHILRDPRFETFRVFYVDDNGKILAHEAFSSRLPSVVRLFSDNQGRDIYKMRQRVKRLGAKGYYLLHNHPSGRTVASTEDRMSTVRIAQQVPGFKAHIIIDHDTYGTIDGSGDSIVRRFPDGPPGDNAMLSPEIDHPVLHDTHGITDPHGVARIARMIKSPDGYVTVIFRAASGKVRVVQEVPVSMFKREKEFGDYIRGRAREFGGADVFAYYNYAGGIASNDLSASAKYLIEEGYLTDFVVGTEHNPMSGYMRGIANPKGSKYFGLGNAQLKRYRFREDVNKYNGQTVGIDFFLAPPEPKTLDEVEVHRIMAMPPQINLPNKDFGIELFDAARRLGSSARYKKLSETVLGRFTVKKDGDKAIQMQTVEDAATLAHEVGHALDYKMNKDSFPNSIKKRFDTVLGERELREELKLVSQIMRPVEGGPERFSAYRRKHEELMADFGAVYLMDPDLAREVAPDVTALYEAKLKEHPDLLGIVEDLHKARLDYEVGTHLDMSVIKPVDRPTSLLGYGDTMDEKIKSLVVNRGRLKRLQELEGYKLTEKWEKDLSAEQLEDVGAAVEGVGNIRTGKSAEEIKASLTPKQQDVLKKYRYYKELSREEINKFLQSIHGPEYIKYIEDYLLHFYIGEKKKVKEFVGRWEKRIPSAKQRRIPTYEEAIEAGLKPVTQNVAWLYRKWVQINWAGAINQKFVEELTKISNADGLPVIMKYGEAPADWPRVDHRAISQVYAKKHADGTVELWHGGAAVDPQAYKYLKGVFQDRLTGPVINAIETFNAYAKWAQLSFSLFHFFNLTESSQASSARWYNPARGVIRIGGEKETAGTGLKIIPGTDIRISMPHLVGLKYQESPEFRRDMAMAGLQINPVPDTMQHRTEKHLMELEVRTRKIPGVNHVIRGVAGFKKGFDKQLWHRYHTGLKAAIYYDVVAQAIGKAQRELTPKELQDIKNKAASIINDGVGSQEWESHFWATPRVQQFLQMGFLAPDYSLSNLRIAGRAITQFRDPVVGSYSRKYWLWMMLSMAGAISIANYAINKRWPWENEPGRRTNIDVTAIMEAILDKVPWYDPDKDPRHGRRYYITIGKQAREVVRYVTDPLEIFGSKASPAVTQVLEQWTGHSPGTAWAMPWVNEGFSGQELGFWETVPMRVTHLADTFKPFAIRGNNFALAFPMRRGMGEWQGRRAWEDLIRGQVDPKWHNKLILKPDTAKLVDDIVAAHEANGIDPSKTFKQAFTNVRTDYYGRIWLSINKEDWEEADRYAQILLDLGVEERQLIQSGERREIKPEDIAEALYSFRKARGGGNK